MPEVPAKLTRTETIGSRIGRGILTQNGKDDP